MVSISTSPVLASQDQEENQLYSEVCPTKVFSFSEVEKPTPPALNHYLVLLPLVMYSTLVSLHLLKCELTL